MIEDPVELWRVLLGRIDVPPDRGLDPEGRDRALVAEIAKRLALDPDRPVEPQLAESTWTAADLTAAVLAAIAPYATMLTDLLRLYLRVGAGSGSSGLTIRWDAHGDRPPLQIDLDGFRRWVAVTRAVVRTHEAPVWTHDSLRRVAAVLESVTASEAAAKDFAVPEAAAERWIQEYDQGAWPAWTPPIALADPVNPAPVLDEIRDAWQSIIGAGRQVSPRRSDLRGKPFRIRSGQDQADEPRPPFDPATLELLDREQWAPRVLRGIAGLRASPGPPLPQLSAVMDRVPRREVPVEVRQRVLIEVLNLPFWSYRRELYAAWVSTLIIHALDEVRLLSSHGRFEYRREGSQLAQIPSRTPPDLELWTELSWPLTTPGRARTTAIRPDYSVVASPVTFPESAALLVEVKHRRKQDTRAYGDALADYAQGCPGAQVILVSDGPVDTRPVASVPAADAGRCHALGELGPDHPERIAQFRSLVRSAIAGPDGVQSGPDRSGPDRSRTDSSGPNEDAALAITLSWSAGGAQDLDLHVHVLPAGAGPWCTVDWKQRRVADVGWLDGDATTAPGRETVRLTAVPRRMAVTVHRYSATGSLVDARPQVMVRGAGIDLQVSCPSGPADAPWWHVLEFDPTSGRVVVPGALSAADPAGGYR